jgi:outer membrane lipoprotein-sorting protein
MKKLASKQFYMHKIANFLNVQKIVTIHYQKPNKNYVSMEEAHNFWELIYADKEGFIVHQGDTATHLKQGEILWLYEPKNGSFTFTSAQERFQNTAVRNSDFNSSNYARDYKIVEKKAEKLGKFGECSVLELEAISKNVSFPKIKMWVSGDNLIRKREDYSLSGQLLRTIAIPSYQKVEAKWVPVSMTILDHLMKRTVNQKTVFERTVVTISKPSLKPLPDDVYTKEYLQRVR